MLRRFKVSDRAAHWIGGLTLGTVMACVLAVLGAMLVSTELPWVGNSAQFFVVVVGVAFGAWSVAYFAMVNHQKGCGYVAQGDVEEWEAREDSRLGVLVPFTYLLGSPEQRQILRYLGQNAPSKPSWLQKWIR